MRKGIFTLLVLVMGITLCRGEEKEIAGIAALREAADSLHNVGRTDSAVIVGAEAIRLAENIGDPTQIVGTHAAQGVFLRSLGRVDEALKSYEKALAIVTSGKFRENPDGEAIEEITSLYINLAVLNLDTQHKEQAAKNAVLSGEWISKSKDPELRSTIYGVVGSVLTGSGDLQNARKYQDMAYRDALESGNNEAAFRAAAYTMLISDRLGDKQDAELWRKKCNELFGEVESMMARLVYYQAECSICLKNDDKRGALKWFRNILELKGIDNLPFVKLDAYNNMHIAYAGLGDYREAYNTLLQSNEIRDSLWAAEKTESLRDLTVKYETKETELALAQSEAKRANTLMWLFASLGILLLGVILFVIYAGRQRRRRLQREIEFANLRADIGRQLTAQYVEGLENERRRMSRELHDGVCNDLLAIQMNMNNGQSPEQTAELIETCRESVRRISHELMPPEFAYATIDEVVRFFIGKQGEANKERITLTYTSSIADADWSEVPDDVALEVYRIIQEGVGNAVKHSGASQIDVSLVVNGSALEVEILDNGVYKSSGKKGLGLDSMRKRAGAIRGSLSVESIPEGRTAVRLNVENYGKP
ncbi:MAG: hypothetical protein K2H46_01865 [Muribaculaceae bacterium]|nr:hypothetical protein [Muribaculaceae bacterium]